MNIPKVECNDCRYDHGFYDVMMHPTHVESQGEDWVNVAYRCPRCGVAAVTETERRERVTVARRRYVINRRAAA